MMSPGILRSPIVGELSRPDRAHTTGHQHSESHSQPTDRVTSPRTVAFDDHISRADLAPALHRTSSSTARRPWSPPTVIHPNHNTEQLIPPSDNAPPQPRPHRSLYRKTLAFFGYGRGASRARRAFVSLIWNLGWGLVQV